LSNFSKEFNHWLAVSDNEAQRSLYVAYRLSLVYASCVPQSLSCRTDY
jgi:hypothetical protein